MSGNRAVRFLKNAAPQLVGFGVGLGAKLYVDTFEADPPQVVAGSDVLMYVHNGLVDIRHVFHRWGQSWASKSTTSGVNIPETLAAAKLAFENDNKSECADHLRDILVSGIGSENGSIAGQCSEHMTWLAGVIPQLHKESLITDMELLVMLTNTVLQHPVIKFSIMDEFRELVVDLPMKLLHSEASNSPSAIIFALTVLTVAATTEATLIEQQRQERSKLPWYSRIFRSEPTSPIVQMILKDPITLSQTMACLSSGVVVPVYLLSCIFHSDKNCLKTLLSHGYIEASSAYLAASSSIGEEGKPSENRENSEYSIDVIQILEHALTESPVSVKRVPEGLAHKVADTVFRAASEHDGYPEPLRCCIRVLLLMVDSGLIEPEWLAKKGVIPLVTQSLAWHGRDPLFVQLLSDFAFRVLNDDTAKTHISETAYLNLKQAIDLINSLPAEGDPATYIMEGDEDSEEVHTAIAELKAEADIELASSEKEG